MYPDALTVTFRNLSVCSMGRGPMTETPFRLKGSMMAAMDIEPDVSGLLPYVNAVATQPELFEIPSFIRFVLQGVYIALYPEQCFMSGLDDREHARLSAMNLMAFLNDVNKRRRHIAPKFKYFKQASILELLKILPRTNCGKCGFASCMTFAAMLSKQKTVPARCPYMGLPVKEQVVYPVLDINGNLVSTVTFDMDLNQNTRMQEKAQVPVSNAPGREGCKDRPEKQPGEIIPFRLTKRELEILRQVARGATNAEISRELFISTHTVKSHVTHIFNKLGVNTRTQACVWAARHNML